MRVTRFCTRAGSIAATGAAATSWALIVETFLVATISFANAQTFSILA